MEDERKAKHRRQKSKPKEKSVEGAQIEVTNSKPEENKRRDQEVVAPRSQGSHIDKDETIKKRMRQLDIIQEKILKRIYTEDRER
jgi:hypothetical protein